jgi:hypothetical protein
MNIPEIKQPAISVDFDVKYTKDDKIGSQMFIVKSMQEVNMLCNILFLHIVSGKKFDEIGHPLFNAIITGFHMEVKTASKPGGLDDKKDNNSKGDKRSNQKNPTQEKRCSCATG